MMVFRIIIACIGIITALAVMGFSISSAIRKGKISDCVCLCIACLIFIAAVCKETYTDVITPMKESREIVDQEDTVHAEVSDTLYISNIQ